MIFNYLKIAIRALYRQKTFSLINIAGLAIALSCAQLIYIYTSHEYTYDRFHVNADNTYRVVTDFKFNDVLDHLALSAPPLADALKSDYPEVERVTQLTQYNQGKTLVKNRDNKQYLENIFFADSSFADIFSFRALAGDIKTALSTPNGMAITHSTAKLFFGQENAIGKTLQFDRNDGSFTTYKIMAVVGDIPKNSHLKFTALACMNELWTIYPPEVKQDWVGAFMYTYIRLKPGTDHKQFEHKLADLFKRKTAGQDQRGVKASCHFIVEPLTDIHLYSKRIWDIATPGNISYVRIFFLTGIFILLIACINYINLTTARAGRRMKEMGIRKITGASKRQLMTQVMTEVCLLSLVSVSFAFVLSGFGTGLLAQLTGTAFTTSDIWTPEVLTASLILLVFITVAGGLYPAYYLQKFQPAQILKSKTIQLNLQTKRHPFTLRKILVTLQFAISITMIVATLTVYRQLHYMLDKDPGFNREHVVSVLFQDTLVASKYPAIKAELLKLPAVQSVSFSQTIPGGPPDRKITRVEGSTNPELVEIPTQPVFMDFEYPQLMEFKLREGNFIQADSGRGYRQSFLINEAAAEKFGWKQALGKRIVFGFNPQSLRDGKVVGVIKNIQTASFKEATEPMIFMVFKKPFAQTFISVRLKGGDMLPAMKSLEKVFASFDPVHPFDPVILDEQIRKLYQSEISMSTLFTVFSSLALLIACIGLLGLVSFITEQKTREIGIRKVMGASVTQIVMMISKDFLIPVITAFIIAIPIAWYAMNQWLQDFPVRLPLHYSIFIFSALFTLLIAWLSISAKTIRSASRNPVDSLRYE